MWAAGWGGRGVADPLSDERGRRRKGLLEKESQCGRDEGRWSTGMESGSSKELCMLSGSVTIGIHCRCE
jgi:hypothetical protein